jgi:erythromycin esterase-like protein
VRVLATLVDKAPRHIRDVGEEAQFDAEQNALVAKNAELYYRTMVGGGAASWNIRDGHMVETLERLMKLHGPGAKAIVWEHNTHVGDARFTDMINRGEYNVGQIVREGHPKDDVVLVGFSTHRGTVVAGQEWDAPMERMIVPPARPGSVEDALHQVSGRDLLVIFGEPSAHPALLEPRGHRAIGVVYHPRFERFGNYVPTILPCRYDALLHIEETHALAPLHAERPDTRFPETYPTGM